VGTAVDPARSSAFTSMLTTAKAAANDGTATGIKLPAATAAAAATASPSVFASMFAAATTEANSDTATQPDPPLRTAETPASTSSSSFADMFAAAKAEVWDSPPPSTAQYTGAGTDSAQRADADEDCCDEGDEECVDLPFCTITFVDESGEAEAIFSPPTMDLSGHGDGVGSGVAVSARATVEVCTGKACTRGGAQEVMSAVRSDLPSGWSVRPAPKCMGMCKKVCVVRVTSDTAQVVHTNVTAASAVRTVLPVKSYPLKSYPAFPAPLHSTPAMPARAVEVSAAAAAGRTGETGGKSAAEGLFAAAVEAVEGGVALALADGGNKVDRKSRQRRGRAGGKSGAALQAARVASRRVDSMDVDAYSMIGPR